MVSPLNTASTQNNQSVSSSSRSTKTSSNTFSKNFAGLRSIGKSIVSSIRNIGASALATFQRLFRQTRTVDNSVSAPKNLSQQQKQSVSSSTQTATKEAYTAPSNNSNKRLSLSASSSSSSSDNIKYFNGPSDSDTITSMASGFIYNRNLMWAIAEHLQTVHGEKFLTSFDVMRILDREVLSHPGLRNRNWGSCQFPFHGFTVDIINPNYRGSNHLPDDDDLYDDPTVFDPYPGPSSGFPPSHSTPTTSGKDEWGFPTPGDPRPTNSVTSKKELHPRGMDEVVSKLKKSLEDRIQKLENNWNQEQVKTDFYNAFGTTDEQPKNQVLHGLKNMRNLVNKLSNNNFKMMTKEEEEDKPNVLAYVYAHDRNHVIRLHSGFFDRSLTLSGEAYKQAANTQKASQTWLLAHELSHFNDVMGTDDQRYKLGIDAFKFAHHWASLLYEQTGKFNADSVAYYLEFKDMDKLEEKSSVSTPGLDQYTENFTEQAKQGKFVKISGRDTERAEVVNLLTRGISSALVGPAGVGKTAFVKDLALRIAKGEIPELQDAEIRALNMRELTGGPDLKWLGEQAGRFKDVLQDLKNAKDAGKKIILFIDEMHGIKGPGNTSGNTNGDFAHAIKEYLGDVEGNNDILVIGATTANEFKEHIEVDPALARRFSPVKVNEPSPENAVLMMEDLAKKYIDKINITDSAIKASVKYASQYRPQGMLPSASGELLVDAINKAIPLTNGVKPVVMGNLENTIQSIKSSLKNFKGKGASAEARARNNQQREELKQKQAELTTFNTNWENQKKIVAEFKSTTNQATQDRLKTELRKAHEAQGILAVIEVDETMIAGVLKERTGIIIGQPTKDEAQVLLNLEQKLNAEIQGQSLAIKKFSGIIKAAFVMAKKDDSGPLATLTLVGPPGTGKTKTVETAARLLNKNFVPLNMGNYNRAESVDQLAATNGPLENVLRHPGSIVLLDEIHQAHPEVRNFFYSALSEGKTVLNGRTYNFKNTIFVLNSNIGQDVINRIDPTKTPQPSTNQLVVDIKDDFRNAGFEDAFISRMGTFVPFMKLSNEALNPIVQQQINEFQAANQRVNLIFDKNAEAQLAKVFKDNVKEGARALNNLFQSEIQSIISHELLKLQEKNLSREDYKFYVTYNKDEYSKGEYSKGEFIVKLVKNRTQN